MGKQHVFGNEFLNENSASVTIGKEGRNYALTDGEKEQICLLYEKDYSLREIAKCYGVSHETIRRAIKAKKTELSLVQKEIVRQRKRQGYSLEQIRKGLAVNDDEFITLETIRKFLESEEKAQQIQSVEKTILRTSEPANDSNKQMTLWGVREVAERPVAEKPKEIQKSNIFGTQISSDFRVRDERPKISENPLE